MSEAPAPPGVMQASTLLLRLIDLADLILKKPALARTSSRLVVEEVGQQIERFEATLRAAGAGDSEAMMLVDVLRKIESARSTSNERSATRFAQVAGVLLPLVREDFGRALEAQRRPTP